MIYTKIILLSLYLFQCNLLFTSEEHIALHNKLANNFMQQFPSMTFTQAGNYYHELENLTQRMIWHKIARKSYEQKNYILSVALALPSLPPELQYIILSENFDALKEKNFVASPKAIEKIKNTPIYELFRWKTAIDKKCGTNNYLKIELNTSWSYYCGDRQPIQLTKPELFNTTLDHVNIIKRIQTDIITKKELLFFFELPDYLQEKLKPYYWLAGDGGYHPNIDRRIKFFYYNKPTLVGIATHTLTTLLFILPPLLFFHFIINPTWDEIAGTQDPLALEQNIKNELHNQIIDTLQKNLVNGSEHLIKNTIHPVPFSSSWSDYFGYCKPIIYITFMNEILITYFFHKIENSKKTYIQVIIDKWNENKLEFLSISTIFYIPILLVSLTASPTAYVVSKICFACGFFNGLAAITLTTVLGCIGYNKVCPMGKKRYKSIAFSKEKFKNKSVRECIQYYLNHPKIAIQD